MAGWYTLDAARLTLVVHVQPNARDTGVAGRHGDALKIRIAAPAVDNKANAMLLDYLRRTLGVPSRSLRIRHGDHGRRKVVEVDAPGEQARAAVAEWDRT